MGSILYSVIPQSGAGSPVDNTVIPVRKGSIYVDETNLSVWISTGDSSELDWKKTGPGIGNLDFSNAVALDIIATTHDLPLVSNDGWRITLSGGGQNLTGIVAPSPVRFDMRFILNADTVSGLQVINEGAASVAENRFILPNGNNDNLDPNGVLVVWYDIVSLRWRILDYQ